MNSDFVKMKELLLYLAEAIIKTTRQERIKIDLKKEIIRLHDQLINVPEEKEKKVDNKK